METAQRVRRGRRFVDVVVTVLLLNVVLAGVRSFFSVETGYIRVFVAAWVVAGVLVLWQIWRPRNGEVCG